MLRETSESVIVFKMHLTGQLAASTILGERERDRDEQTDRQKDLVGFGRRQRRCLLARESRFQRHAALRNLSFSPAVSKPLIV